MDLSRSIGRADKYRVTARRRDRPIIAPEDPRSGRTRRLNYRCSPMLTVIYANLNKPYPPCACKGESLYSLVKSANPSFHGPQIDSRHRLYSGGRRDRA